MHQELISCLAAGPGLVLVTGLTGHGKTTAIEAVLADPGCPPNVGFLGDLCGDVELARRAVELARSNVVVAVLRIAHGAAAFRRLVDMGVSPMEVAEVVRVVFTTRLIRVRQDVVLVHERLDVSPSIRALVLADVETAVIHQRSIAEGMQTLRQAALEHARAGRISYQTAIDNTPDT